MGSNIDKKVKVLSGGEKSRLAIIKLLLEPYNLLVLDEPTNHLDLISKDILKSALLKYDGTLIVVSHDRDFMDGLVDKVYEFKDKKVKEHIGSIYEFLKKKNLSDLKQLERKKGISTQSTEQKRSESKNNYLEKKDKEKRIRKVEKELARIEEEIGKLEEQKEEFESLMSNPEGLKENQDDIFTSYQNTEDRLNTMLDEWEAVNLELEKLHNQL